MQLDYPLDENGLLMLRMEHTGGDRKITFRIYSRYEPSQSPLVKHLLPLVQLESGAQTIVPASASFATTLGDEATLKINGQPFCKITLAGDMPHVQTLRKLSVFETRIIGRAAQANAPYPIRDQDPDAILSPLTDLHTHLSAQISSRQLIEMGLRYDVPYPTAALDKLHIPYDRQSIKYIPKRVFLPLAHLQSSKDGMEPAVGLTTLDKESLGLLEKALSISPETQSTFEAVETCYYLREPFTKNLEMLPDLLHAVAQSYSHQGIRYAELSSNAVLDPAWLAKIHEVMPAIEKETGTQLRFKAGLPRNLDDEAMHARIEQYKRIAASPYVVGADILGYEINKTSHMQRHLEGLAQWMASHQPDGILQIHAGENAKNLANVREALQLAHDYGIRLHLGHSLYGIDQATLALAQEVSKADNLIVQFNFDSNLAINNIDMPHDAPIAGFLALNIPSVLGSDGAGMYLTTAKQTAQAGLFCGVTREGFRRIRETEEAHIRKQQEIFEQKMRAQPDDFFTSLTPIAKPAPKTSASAEPQKPQADLERLIASKRPLFFGGAGGTSWENVSAQAQEEFRKGLVMLLEQLDADKVYFVKGRTKGSGVNIELEKAISQYNRTHGKPFACVTMLAESEDMSAPATPQSYVMKLSAPLVFLPTAITGFIKEHDGLAFYAGGKNFTRDFILASAETGIPFGMMADAHGASSEKAQIYADKAFTGAQGMVAHAAKLKAEIFSNSQAIRR